MDVKLLAHTQLSEEFAKEITANVADGQVIALTAIRTCYSHNKPSEIVGLEGEKYFGSAASDGKGGNDADRLLRHIVNSGHSSTLEHLNYTFAIEGVSRSLLAQITRHRHLSFSVQSQRYNKLESGSKSGGFDYVIPPSVKNCKKLFKPFESLGDDVSLSAEETFESAMRELQAVYNHLRELGIPAEDARFVLPNAATCNLVLTGNLRSFLEFCEKREAKAAQWEIRELAELIKNEIINAEPWTESFFNNE